MRDRVAEVLAERAMLDNGAAAGLALSVALHAAITAAAVYAALHRPAPQLTNILNIRFAPVPQAAEPLTAPATTPATPVKQAVPQPVQQPVQQVPQPVVQPAQPKPVAQPVLKNTAPPDAFGRSNKKPGAFPPPPAPHSVTSTAPVTAQPAHAPAVPGVANPDDIAAGNSGVTGLEGGDFPYTIYIDRMRNLIGTHWFRPQGTAAAATIHFVINRDGTIRDVTLDTSSGNGVFDRAAQRAVVEASPLPPLPFAYSGTYLGVHLTFR